MSILPELPYSCKEKSGGFLIAWMLLMLSQADESIHLFFSEPLVRENIAFILGFLGLMLLLPVFIAGYQFLVWKKNWIYLEEQTLVIERNTLRRKKNTYNLAHISNINTEQNLFELMIHYGFFRKQDYTIPINRIHALRILEPPIARLTGRCEVQLVCIGVGDSKEELTQLSLCRKKAALPPYLQELLPEFSSSLLYHMQRPSKHAGKIYFCSCLFWLLLCSLLPCGAVSGFHLPKNQEDAVFLFALLGISSLFILLYHLFRYSCLGFALDDSLALCSSGSLTRTITIVPYGHIQHLQWKQNPVSRHYHLFHGSVFILASALNREIAIPYITEREKDLLTKKLLLRR